MSRFTQYAIDRLGQAVLSLVVATFATFALLQHYRTREYPALAFDTLDSYWEYVNQLAALDLGYSAAWDGPVKIAVLETAPWTFLLAFSATVIALSTGIVLGLLMAFYEGSVVDGLLSTATILLRSTPAFTLALLSLMFLFYRWGIFTKSRGLWAIGTTPGINWAFAIGVAEHAALPVFVLAAANILGVLTMRSSAVRILGQQYVRAARIRGLRPSRVAFSYVGKNALPPAYTQFLVSFAELLGATVIIEYIFSYPGLGFYLLEGGGGDPMLFTTAVVIFALVAVLGVLLADLTYGLIDPRAYESAETSRGPLRTLRAWASALRRRVTGSRDRPEDVTAHLSDAEVSHDVDTSLRGTIQRGVGRVVAPLRIAVSDVRGKVGATILAAYALLAIFGPMFTDYPEWNDGKRLLQPFENPAFPLGTNHMGQGLLELMVEGMRPTFEIIVPGAILVAVLATAVGLIAGYVGGVVDRILMAVSDLVIALPGLIVVIALSGMLGMRDPVNAGLLLGVTYWGAGAREIRSQVLTLRNATHVEAARALGLSTPRILVREILPTIYPYGLMKLVDGLRYVTVCIMTLYYLGFYGRGLNSPMARDVNWGVIFFRAEYEGLALFNPDAQFWLFIPITALVLFLLGTLLLSQGFDRAANARLRTQSESGIPVTVAEEESD